MFLKRDEFNVKKRFEEKVKNVRIDYKTVLQERAIRFRMPPWIYDTKQKKNSFKRILVGSKFSFEYQKNTAINLLLRSLM